MISTFHFISFWIIWAPVHKPVFLGYYFIIWKKYFFGGTAKSCCEPATSSKQGRSHHCSKAAGCGHHRGVLDGQFGLGFNINLSGILSLHATRPSHLLTWELLEGCSLPHKTSSAFLLGSPGVQSRYFSAQDSFLNLFEEVVFLKMLFYIVLFWNSRVNVKAAASVHIAHPRRNCSCSSSLLNESAGYQLGSWAFFLTPGQSQPDSALLWVLALATG